MTDVQPGAAGVREHVEDVEFGLVRPVGRAECLVLFPVFLPARLDGFWIVSRHAPNSFAEDCISHSSRRGLETNPFLCIITFLSWTQVANDPGVRGIDLTSCWPVRFRAGRCFSERLQPWFWGCWV